MEHGGGDSAIRVQQDVHVDDDGGGVISVTM